MNFVAQKFARQVLRQQQHRQLQPHLTRSFASSVWRQCSEQVAGQAHTRRSSTPISILLWGSNARAAHPIFFHHVLKGIHNGAKLVVVDPRRTESAEWADLWLGIDVGTDIALSNTIAREIIVNDLQHHAFIDGATTGFEEYRDSVMEWTLERGEAVTGVPAEMIQEVAHAYAKADRADDLLDARDHGTPQRGRQRARR